MDRRTNSTLLLPLMAILALIYPVAFSPRQTASPPGTESKIRPTAAPLGETSASCPEAHSAKKTLCEFFGYPGPQQDPQDPTDRRNRYQLDFVIVTIPDPLDSRLPYLFDRNLSSIQRAAEADHFVLDRFDLPWIEEIRKKVPAKEDEKAVGDAKNDGTGHHSFEREPGYILFRDPEPGNAPDSQPPRALLVFLVGETPTTGIHKQAFILALDQIRELCNSPSLSATSKATDQGSQSNRQSPRTENESTCNTIKILGPSFSGSAESLDFALHSWLDSHSLAGSVGFRIRSGTATAIPFSKDDPNCLYFRFSAAEQGNSPPTFASAVARDTIVLDQLLSYLRSQHRGAFRVALLTEGNTAYGSSMSRFIDLKNVKNITLPGEDVGGFGINNLPFPLHISRLRSESEKARRERQQSTQQEAPNPDTSLPLPTEDDSGDAIDSIPPVSQLDISSSELMLSNLLSTISHEQFNYVGIAATDVRDVIFLAREIREHSPSTVIFALNADLLYAHPEANRNTRGMLVITPYPLFALNQLWLSPNSRDGGGTRIQFPDQGSEGIYNAMLALLGKEEQLLEYASPFEIAGSKTNERVPPLWIVTVGRDGFWPVAIRGLHDQDPMGYTLRARLVPSPKPSNRGIVPQLTHVVLILWSALCLVPALIFLTRADERPLHWPFANRFLLHFRSKSLLGHLFKLNYPDAKAFYLIGGTATLSTYALGITAYSVSAIQRPDGERWLFMGAMLLILVTGMAACYSLGSDILRYALKPRVRRARLRRLWLAAPVVASSLACWALTMSLTGEWIWLRFFNVQGPGDGILTGFRAVNLSNGVSPLPPLFFLSLAAVAWAFCAIRRLRMIEEIPAIPSQLAPGSAHNRERIRRDPSFFYSNKRSFRGLEVLELKVYHLLTCPSVRFPPGSRTVVYLCLVLSLAWGAYLFFYRLVYAFESRFFYLLLGLVFLLVYAAVLVNVLRLFFLWRAVRALLQRLGRLPIRDAFSRFNRAHRSMPRMNLASAPTPLTALGCSVGEAHDLLAHVQEHPAIRNKEVDGIVEQAKEIVQAAQMRFERALEAQAFDLHESCLSHQIEAERNLNRFTRSVEDVLEISWGTSFSGPKRAEDAADLRAMLRRWLISEDEEKERIEAARKTVTDQAEEFLVSRTVHFLTHIFPQLTNLASYSLVCLFLMLLAVSSYPLQPKNPFGYFIWFVILVFVGVALHMSFQMNRDAILSYLNGTKPGVINWDAEFIGRMVILIVIPILGLLGVQFPETIGQFVRWLAPAGAGHK